MLLDDSSSGTDVMLSSPGSSLIEFYAAAAVASVPPATGGDAAPFDASQYQGEDGGDDDEFGVADQPDANKTFSGGVAGKGGRPEGTGIRTRGNYGRGALRVVAECLQMRGTAGILDDAVLCNPAENQRLDFASLLNSWRNVPGREELWALPYFLGVGARFSVWGKTEHGKRSSCCTWVTVDGFVRCTCVGSDVYNADVSESRPSTCEHVEVLSAGISQMADALARPVAIILKWLYVVMSDKAGPSVEAFEQVDEETPVWRLHKDIVAVVSSHHGKLVPVPVYLPKKGVSCGFCPLTNLRGCSHTRIAEQYRVGGGQTDPPMTSSNGVRSAVSSRPVSLFNCPKAVTFDRSIGEMARSGQDFVLEAPNMCCLCGANLPSRADVPDTSLPGIIHSTLGPCNLVVVRRKCRSCGHFSSRDGRENMLILLSWTSACTVVWGRRCAESVRAGTHISDVISQCQSDWVGLKSAGLLPATSRWRGADTLRGLILTFMRLSVVDPDRGLYDCSVCRMPCGRYLVVTSDAICLGFDTDSLPFSFDHLCEPASLVNMKSREGCMVLGEQARRMMRHVLVPGDPPGVTDRTLPSSELALTCLVPGALSSKDAPTASASASSIRTLLGMVWNIEAAAIPLAESLVLAYDATKVKRIKEKERRATCAKHLRAYIVQWRAESPEAAALATKEWQTAQPDMTAAAPGGDGGGAGHGAGVVGRGQPNTSRAKTGGRPAKIDAKNSKSTVKPGEEPELHIPKALLRPLMRSLDDNDVDHICRMALAFALDPVIAGIKTRHFDGLTSIVAALRSDNPRLLVRGIVADATCRSRGARPLTQAADCLVQLRHVMVALQAAVLLIDASPAFAVAIADVFENAVACARSFYADFAPDVKAKHEYLARYLDADMTEESLVAAFKKRYPNAADKADATGIFTPGRPQCRAEAYAKGDKTSCGTCEKGYVSSERYSDGALTLCCACSHPKILGFVVLDRKESPQVLINALLTRFPKLPRYLVYDFACGVVRCAMVKLPWMLRELSVVSDRFHVCNHTCSHFYNANSYGELDYKNTLTHEQRNAAIRKMQAILRGAGRYGYLALLCYQTSVLNSFAESRTEYQQAGLAARDALDAAAAREGTGARPAARAARPSLALPRHFDFRADYFSRHPCRCCGYMTRPSYATGSHIARAGV